MQRLLFKISEMFKKRNLYNSLFKLYLALINIYNMVLLSFFLFIINSLSLYKVPRIGRFIWRICFFFLYKNASHRFYWLLNLVYNFTIILFYSILIFFFSFGFYFVFIFLIEESFLNFHIFACNKALLFFFLNIFFYAIFFEKDFFFSDLEFSRSGNLPSDYDSEWEDFNLEFDNADLWDDDFIETESDSDYHDGEEGLFNEFKNEKDYLYVDAFDDIGIVNEGEDFDDDEYESEFLDGLYFFDRWLGISNELLVRIYTTSSNERRGFSKVFYNKLNSETYQNLLNKELNYLFYFLNINDFNAYIFKNFDNYYQLVSFLFLIEKDNLHLSDSLLLNIQMQTLEEEEAYEDIYIAALSNNSIDKVRGFFNKFYVSNKSKVTFLSIFDLQQNFLVNFKVDSNIKNKSVVFNNSEYLSFNSNFYNLNYKNLDKFTDFFSFKVTNFLKKYDLQKGKSFSVNWFENNQFSSSRENPKLINNYTIDKLNSLFFYENDELDGLQKQEIKNFLNFFFRFILQEKFNDEDFFLINNMDIKFFQTGFFKFFFFSFVKSLSLLINFFFIDFLVVIFNKFPNQNNTLFKTFIYQIKKDNDLILLLYMWKNFESKYFSLNNDLKFYSFFRSYLNNSSFDYFIQDYFYAFNTIIDESDEILMDEQNNNHFGNTFDKENRPLFVSHPFIRYYYLTNTYNERSLYYNLDGNFEFYFYLPQVFLRPALSYKSIKYNYFIRKNRSIDYQKRKKLNLFVNSKKDNFKFRFNNYLFFYFTKVLFFIFDFKYWVLRFVPFIFDVLKVYGYGGTFVEFNNKTYSSVVRKLYNIGLSFFKADYDSSQLYSSINYWDNKFDKKSYFINSTEDLFPTLVLSNLSFDFAVKFNIYFDLYREFEILFFLVFLKKELNSLGFNLRNYYKEIELKDWLKLYCVNDINIQERKILLKTRNVFYSLFFDLCSIRLYKISKYVKPISLDPVIRYFENEKKHKLKKKKRKKFSLKKLFNFRLNLISKWKTKHKKFYFEINKYLKKKKKICVKKRKYNYLLFDEKEKELLSIFFNKTWMNEYSEFEYEEDESWDELDFLQGGLFDFEGEEDNLELLDITEYNTFVWDWQLNNWETVLNLFLDIDRFFNTDAVEDFEEHNNNYYTIFLIALFFWLYCRIMRFINYNDSQLLPYILKYTKFDTSVSAFRFFFENMVRSSSGRSRTFGDNYIGVNRRLFSSFVPISYWVMLTPITRGAPEFNKNFDLAVKSEFSLRQLKLAMFFREELFKTHLNYGKGFYSNESARFFKNSTLKWVLYGRLKRFFKFDDSFIIDNSLSLSLLKNFFLIHKNPKQKRRKILKKRNNFLPILRIKFFDKFLGYNPLIRTSKRKSVDKFLHRLYRRTIIQYARKKYLTPYEYEVYYGGYDSFPKKVKRIFNILAYLDDNFMQYETRFRKFIGESLYFNVLKRNFIDESGKKHYSSHISDFFVYDIYNSLMRNNVQYRFDIRQNYNQAVYKFPELVKFLYYLSPERRKLFLNSAGFYNLFFKYFFEFIGDDFLMFNDKKDKFLLDNKSLNFNTWFNFIYKKPFNLFLIDKKVKSDSNEALSNFYKIFFSSDYGWDLESWLDLQHSDLDLDAYIKFFKYGIIDWLPFAGNLTLERMGYFMRSQSENILSFDLIKRAFEEPEFDFRYYLFGERRARYLFLRELARNPNYYSVRDNFMPTYRFLSPKESWWTSFNIHTLFFNKDLYNHLSPLTLLNITNEKSNFLFYQKFVGYRRFRAKSYKNFYLEGLFNLGRQSVDYLEGENGYNLTLDYFANANTQEFFDDTFNISNTNKSHYWFLGNSNFYLENKRQLWNIPTWIWSFVLRRHFENPPNSIPNYLLHYHIMPNFSKTNMIVYRGKYFYNDRRYISNPLEYTFEEIQFPSEEGFLGGVFVPAIVHLMLDPIFKIFTFLKYYSYDWFLIFFSRINRTGDINNRPDWLSNINVTNTSLILLKKNIYRAHLGEKNQYIKFSDYPSDFFISGKDIPFFIYLDNIRRLVFTNSGRSDNLIGTFNENKYRKKEKNNQQFLFYFPFKPFFTRNNYFYFNNILIYISIYLIIYYFLWIPINYLTYTLNYWFDEEYGFDVVTEDNILYREDFYYDLLNIPNSEIDNSSVFYDYNFRAPKILSDIDMFSFLFNINSLFVIDRVDALETLQFQAMDTKMLQFYGSVTYNFLRWEYLDLFLLKIYDYNSFSYNLLDVFDLSKQLFYKDNMKMPLPENRAVFSEFLNILTGSEVDLVDYIEEYNNNLKNNSSFNAKFKNYKLFIKKIKTKQYLGDCVFIAKKKHNLIKKKKFKNKTLLNKSYITSLDDFIVQNITNENTIRNTIWWSINFFNENINLMHICATLFITTDQYNNFLFTERYNINLIYYTETLVFFSLGKWGFLKYGSYFEQLTQYKVGEQMLPFYLRFFRSDVLNFDDISYYEKTLVQYLDHFNNSFLGIPNNNNNNTIIKFNKLFDVKDIFFSHRINNESNLSTEYMVNMFFNFKQYLNQSLLQDEYKFLDSFIFNEHTQEMISLYSNELFSEISLADLELFDWELIIEQAKDWFICYPNNLKVELMDLPNVYNYMYEYYLDEYNRNLDRNFLFLFYYEIFDYKFKLKSHQRKTFFDLQNTGYSYFMSRLLSNTTKYWSRKIILNNDFEDEIDSQPFLQPDFETDELLDEIEFPDKYTLFSKFIDSYQTDYFSSFYLFENQNKVLLQKSLKNEDFIKFYTLQFFNKDVIKDTNQKFLNVGEAINLRLNNLSTSQLVFYNYYINIKYNKILLNKYQNKYFTFFIKQHSFNKKTNIKDTLIKIIISIIPSFLLLFLIALLLIFVL